MLEGAFRGLYRNVGWAYVTNSIMSFRVPEDDYRALAYEPAYEKLPWKEDYFDDRPLGHVELEPTAPAIKQCWRTVSHTILASHRKSYCFRSLDRVRPLTSVVQGFQILRWDFLLRFDSPVRRRSIALRGTGRR
jgi:hypothetical protein